MTQSVTAECNKTLMSVITERVRENHSRLQSSLTEKCRRRAVTGSSWALRHRQLSSSVNVTWMTAVTDTEPSGWEAAAGRGPGGRTGSQLAPLTQSSAPDLSDATAGPAVDRLRAVAADATVNPNVPTPFPAAAYWNTNGLFCEKRCRWWCVPTSLPLRAYCSRAVPGRTGVQLDKTYSKTNHAQPANRTAPYRNTPKSWSNHEF